MARIIGTWIPNPHYAGNNIKFVEPTIDEQIENLKVRYSWRMADLDRLLQGLEDDYQREMAALLAKKAAMPQAPKSE